jgi:hypothetical protein
METPITASSSKRVNSMTTNYGSAHMKGVVVFRSLTEAVRYGFEPYAKTDDGYLVRTRTSAGWALALVKGHEQ